MKGSDYIFDFIDLLYYKCHKINLNRTGSYIDTTDWLRKEKSIINSINGNNKCF